MAQSKALSKGTPKINKSNQPIQITNQLVQPFQISLFNQQAQATFELQIIKPLMTKVSQPFIPYHSFIVKRLNLSFSYTHSLLNNNM